VPELWLERDELFLAAVAHELRAPLTTLLLWEKVLRDDRIDAELRKRALDAIHQSAMQQARLIGDLLDVSRAISGKLHVDMRALDLPRIVDEAVEAISPALASKQLTLVVRLDPSVGIVIGDAVRLRQVIDNLLLNALKFTEAGGNVEVALHAGPRTVVLEVKDTGCGFAPDLLAGLFEPFRQAENALTRRHGGLGLGLAISRMLVTLHDGTIEAASPGPGQGATFTVRLPVTTERRSATPPQGTGLRTLHRVRVLVVDDDPRVCEALGLLLRRAGAVVATATSAQEARARGAEVMPQILLCDVAMPEEDGLAWIRKLRAAGDRTPAIALTGHATTADVVAARDAGFDLHIAKPIDFERLVTSIRELLVAK
jgi:CheY-like chemotaxis protein/two-component sensor histidine kinase